MIFHLLNHCWKVSPSLSLSLGRLELSDLGGDDRPCVEPLLEAQSVPLSHWGGWSCLILVEMTVHVLNHCWKLSPSLSLSLGRLELSDLGGDDLPLVEPLLEGQSVPLSHWGG
ncbi:hypothetical protein ACOMHN_041013 [Nucella lapillus]